MWFGQTDLVSASCSRSGCNGRVSGRPFLCSFLMFSSLPGDEPVQLVTVRTVGAKCLFIEKPLDAAAEANLIRMLLVAHRPAHSAMPATAKNQHRSASYSSGYQTEGDLPTGLLFFCHQNPSQQSFNKARNLDYSSSVASPGDHEIPALKAYSSKEKRCDYAKSLVTYSLECAWSRPNCSRADLCAGENTGDPSRQYDSE